MVARADLLTWRQACAQLGIKRRALQYAVARGELEVIHVPVKGRKTSPRYRPEDVKRLKRQWREEASRA